VKIKYNAPVTFTYILISALILLISTMLHEGGTPGPLVYQYFSVEGATFDWSNTFEYLRFISHVFGHYDWNHLHGVIIFMIIIGPILEEKYNSKTFFGIMLGTTIITGLFMAMFQQPLVFGGSTLVYMMILLMSFTRINPGEFPVNLILIFIAYLVTQMLSLGSPGSIGAGGESIASADSIILNMGTSNLAHLIGGICGIMFGFMNISRTNAPSPQPMA